MKAKKVNFKEKEKTKTIEEVVGQAIGEASMCWSETPTGVFESTKATELNDSVLSAVTKEVEKEKQRIVALIITKGHNMTAEYKSLINYTGGLLNISMGYAYSKGIQDVIKLITKENK